MLERIRIFGARRDLFTNDQWRDHVLHVQRGDLAAAAARAAQALLQRATIPGDLSAEANAVRQSRRAIERARREAQATGDGQDGRESSTRRPTASAAPTLPTILEEQQEYPLPNGFGVESPAAEQDQSAASSDASDDPESSDPSDPPHSPSLSHSESNSSEEDEDGDEDEDEDDESLGDPPFVPPGVPHVAPQADINAALGRIRRRHAEEALEAAEEGEDPEE